MLVHCTAKSIVLYFYVCKFVLSKSSVARYEHEVRREHH